MLSFHSSFAYADSASLDERCLAEFDLSIPRITGSPLDGDLLRNVLREKFTAADADTIFGLIDTNEEGFCGVINIQKGVSLRKTAYQIIIHHRHAWLRSRPRPSQENWQIVEGEFVLHERGKPGIVFKSEK